MKWLDFVIEVLGFSGSANIKYRLQVTDSNLCRRCGR